MGRMDGWTVTSSPFDHITSTKAGRDGQADKQDGLEIYDGYFFIFIFIRWMGTRMIPLC